MYKLYPVAKPETRHLFVDPVIYEPWEFFIDGYPQPSETGYIKPGTVPNLMELCRPSGVKFSITEEPNPDCLAITGILIAVKSEGGFWVTCAIDDLNVKLNKEGPGTWSLVGDLTIPKKDLVNGYTYEELTFDNNDPLLVQIDLQYVRGSRTLTYSNNGNYDNCKPQLLGITLDLRHKDSAIIHQ